MNGTWSIGGRRFVFQILRRAAMGTELLTWLDFAPTLWTNHYNLSPLSIPTNAQNAQDSKIRFCRKDKAAAYGGFERRSI